MTEIDLERLKRSILRVGPNKGRGFVVENSYGGRCIITAAHCLPAMPDSFVTEDPSCYGDLIGPLGEKPSIEAEVAFVDPTRDIAILKGWREEYDAFVDPIEPLTISPPPDEGQTVLTVSLDGDWV